MIKLIDSVVQALSLHITNPEDILKYEEAYTALRLTLPINIDNEVGLNYEPSTLNRFHVNVPAEFNIYGWQINGISLPQVGRDFFGRKKWSSVTLRIMELLSSSPFAVFDERFDDVGFPIIFQTLDPTGMPVTQLTIYVTKILNISSNDFNMDTDFISHTEVEFKVKKVIVNY